MCIAGFEECVVNAAGGDEGEEGRGQEEELRMHLEVWRVVVVVEK